MKCDELEAYGMNDPAIGDEYEMYKVSDVDAAIEELKAQLRKTQRALWLARAYRAGEHYRRYHGKYICPLAEIPEYQKWLKVEHKCRAKAEEYYK